MAVKVDEGLGVSTKHGRGLVTQFTLRCSGSRARAIILFSLVPSSHNVLSRLVGSSGAYALGTVLMLALVAAMPAVWPQTGDFTP